MITNAEKFIKFCESEFGKRVLEKEAEYIYKELKDCQRILDIGCGIGQFEERLQDLNVTGLDSSEEMLEEAKRRSNKTFIFGDAKNLPFKNSSFDAVFYAATLEFIENYKKAISEALRVLEPEGKLVVMMLNSKSDYFLQHMQKENSYFRKIKHANLKEIKDYTTKYYHIVKEEYFLGIKDKEVFDTSDKKYASLYIIVGAKKLKTP